MGYAVYEDQNARNFGVVRWAGYGVPAICDLPSCDTKIDRGLDFKCDTIYTYDEAIDVEAESEGCGMFFCAEHQQHTAHTSASPKADTEEWTTHMLTDESWQTWRDQNPEFTGRNGRKS